MPITHLRSSLTSIIRRLGDASRRLGMRAMSFVVGDERGQSTVEYALILLGAAAIALALVSWVTGSNVVGRLFDSVVGRILRQV